MTYGKAGTTGQTRTKKFEDEKTSLIEAQKLLNEKFKKGYVEKQGAKTDPGKSSQKGGAETDYLLEWKKIANHKNPDDLPKLLTEHFSYLADMPGFDAVLWSLLQNVKHIEIRGEEEKNKEMVIRFRNDDDELIASSPALGSEYKTYPHSFQNLMKKHERLYLNRSSLLLGNDGGFEVEGLEDAGSEWLSLVKKPSQIQVALSDGPDWWLYHPKKKNSFGEPSLHFCSHGDMKIEEDGESYNAGAFFLKRLVERLQFDIPVPRVSIEAKTPDKKKNEWWKYLVWILNEKPSPNQSRNLYYRPKDGLLTSPPSDDKLSQGTEVRFDGLTSLDQVPLGKMSALDKLVLLPGQEKKAPKLLSLEGVERAPWLVRLNVSNQEVSDIGPLSKLPNLEVFDGSYNSIKELSPLSKCRNLKILYLNKNKISDISPLFALLEIETLWISDNPVKDILPLAELKKLKELKIPLKVPKENLAKFEKLRSDVKISY
ncbi:leucine rich repeat protein [Leptospira weilii serovar Ranarum str. ICFT]|uniref:Leucine rich repeat protein n=1 Tax=Leptospira weilii serovar Ranarum str. ICFT TaxID=1218598 RepID=N1W9W8_9LEPT|nr:leucine rich repeat protein [Leptospira weilii serovar Ranarum str. ICFT]